MSVWTTWLEELTEKGPLGCLLYVGADGPEVLAALPEDGIRRLVIANPNPTFHETLEDYAEQDATVLFVPKAVTAEGEQVSLYEMSLPWLSALAAPQDVTGLFPGATVSPVSVIDGVSLAHLLAQAPAGPKVIRAELLGNAEEIVSQLAALPVEDRVDHVFLRIAQPGLYAPTSDIASLFGLLDTAGYTQRVVSEQDPDFPEYWFAADHGKRQLLRLKAELSAAREALTESATGQDKAEELERAQAELEENAKTIAYLTEMNGHKTARIEELSVILMEQEEWQQRYHEQIETLTAERDTAFAKMQESVPSPTADSNKADLEAATQQIGALTRKLEATERARDQKHAYIEDLEGMLRESKENFDARLERLQFLSDTASQRSAMAEADLRELGERHAQILNENKAQSALLEEIAERLAAVLPAPRKTAGKSAEKSLASAKAAPKPDAKEPLKASSKTQEKSKAAPRRGSARKKKDA